MPETQTFPVATKVTLYANDNKFYERLPEREAKHDPQAVRMVFGERVCWFRPCKTAGDLLKETEPPEAA